MRIGTLKESYIADAALFDSRTQKVWLAIAAALLVLFPFVASDYWLYLACLVGINVASATGLNILTGYTGLVSLGQAAFMGLGAYTVAILQISVGHAVPAQPAGGRLRRHAGRSDRRHSLAAREGPVPGHRHHRGVLHRAFPLRQHEVHRRHRRPGVAAGERSSAWCWTPRFASTG